MEDDSVNKANYHNKRRALIATEHSYRADSSLYSSISEKECAADGKIRSIRSWELHHVWNHNKPVSAEQEEVDDLIPGMGFLTAKKYIQNSSLFKLLKKMPKGALLHCHIDATVDVKLLLRMALEFQNIHMRIPFAFPSNIRSIDDCASSELPLPEFKTLKLSQLHDDDDASYASLLSSTPDKWFQLQAARKHFPSSLGGEEGFDKWIHKAMTIDPVEAYRTHSTVAKIWKKFGSVFGVLDGLIRNEIIFRQYVYESLKTALSDGISYMEIRILFYFEFMYSAEGENVIPHRGWMMMFRDAIQRIRAELSEHGREAEFVGAKVIYTTMRNVSCERMHWYLEDCLSLKKEFPDLIAGFDIVGPENDPTSKPLVYYLEPFFRFKDRQKEMGLDIPFIFHAGETLGDGDQVDRNLFDALLLGTKRIGHGFSMVKHPHLMKLCKEKNIAMEVCPISNEVLRLTSTMPMHPIATLIAHGVPVTLNSDDPAIWGSEGVTFDYYQVLISSEVSGLITLKEIARRGLEVSCLEGAERGRAIELWTKAWDRFIDEVLEFKT